MSQVQEQNTIKFETTNQMSNQNRTQKNDFILPSFPNENLKIQQILQALQVIKRQNSNAKSIDVKQQDKDTNFQNHYQQNKEDNEKKILLFIMPIKQSLKDRLGTLSKAKLNTSILNSSLQICWFSQKFQKSQQVYKQNNVIQQKQQPISLNQLQKIQNILQKQNQNKKQTICENQKIANGSIQNQNKKQQKIQNTQAQFDKNNKHQIDHCNNQQEIEPNIYVDSVIDQEPSSLQNQSEISNLDLAFIEDKIQEKNKESFSIFQTNYKKKINKVKLNEISQFKDVQNTSNLEQNERNEALTIKKQKNQQRQVASQQKTNQKNLNKNQEKKLTQKYRQKFIFNVEQVKKQYLTKQQWFKQLLKINNAQTQITYLTQQFDWNVKFIQESSQLDIYKFQCTTQVIITTNQLLKKFNGICKFAKSKRQARHHSSILCLANIYAEIKGIYENFKQLKKQKPALKQQMKSDNSQILSDWLEENKQKKIMQINLDQNNKNLDYKPSVDDYIDRLQSCKRQLYYFVAQNNKIFMPPKWTPSLKQNLRGLWNSQCTIKYEIQERMYEYKHQNLGKNQKEAQEIVSKKMLKQMYRDFPGLFLKFKKIKLAKGLK